MLRMLTLLHVICISSGNAKLLKTHTQNIWITFFMISFQFPLSYPTKQVKLIFPSHVNYFSHNQFSSYFMLYNIYSFLPLIKNKLKPVMKHFIFQLKFFLESIVF